uniref:Uncharacterized protein n=1 Tax=Arundo donax TaxID=35708 RepID=A0A0A9B2K8_ARUDO
MEQSDLCDSRVKQALSIYLSLYHFRPRLEFRTAMLYLVSVLSSVICISVTM